jgi:hypothetical protein
LQRGPKAKLPRTTYSIFRSDCHLPITGIMIDLADRQLRPVTLLDLQKHTIEELLIEEFNDHDDEAETSQIREGFDELHTSQLGSRSIVSQCGQRVSKKRTLNTKILVF